MAIGPPCSQCGRTLFHEDDGLLYCDEGHQQEGGPLAGEDEGDYGVSGKVHRKRGIEGKQKISKVFRGIKGYRLFIQAWQFILWKQCYNLVHDRGLPTDLWGLVKELWSLWLPELVHRLRDTASTNADDTAGMSTASGSTARLENEQRATKSAKLAKDSPTLPDTIALIYIAILLMRQPISLATIYSYVRREEICYIRAIRHVPEDIKDHLASEYYAALDTTIIPTQQSFQGAIMRTIALYSNTFGVVVPPVNWSLLLFQCIRELALPLEIFPTVKYLSGLVKFDFTYPSYLSVRRSTSMLPEAQVMGLIVVATKLLFPFDTDSAERHPYSVNEPAAVQIDWNAWMAAQEDNFEEATLESAIEPGKEIEINDRDVMSMNDDQLDQYMNWFQRTYTTEHESDGLQKEIINMFPLEELPEEVPNNAQSEPHKDHAMLVKLQATQSALQSRPAISDDEIDSFATTLRPGERYERFHSVGDLTGPALLFHQKAAELASLDIESLVRVSLSIESSLLLHQHEARRAKAFSNGIDA